MSISGAVESGCRAFITAILKLCRLQESPFDGVWPHTGGQAGHSLNGAESDTLRIWDATLSPSDYP